MTRISQKGTAFELTGPAEAPVVVLVHGIGLTSRIWDRYVPVLAERFRVLSYDLCGHGDSALPDQKPNLTVLSDQLCALLDELLIDRCAIIGFSLGGMINRRFAMDHPNRVTALVILNSPHERTPEAQKLVEERAAATNAGGVAATIDATLERWFTPAFRQSSAPIFDWVRSTVLANNAENFAQHRQVLASGVVELIRPVPAITAPSLVMTCENDSGSTPDMSSAIAAEIPGARAIIVPDLQHLGLLEEPDQFCRPILQFLSRALTVNEATFTRKMTCPS